LKVKVEVGLTCPCLTQIWVETTQHF